MAPSGERSFGGGGRTFAFLSSTFSLSPGNPASDNRWRPGEMRGQSSLAKRLGPRDNAPLVLNL